MKLNSFQGDLYIWGNLKLLPFTFPFPVTVGSGRVGFLFYSVTRVNSAPEA